MLIGVPQLGVLILMWVLLGSERWFAGEAEKSASEQQPFRF